jgi:hypothetical protein
MTIAIGNNSNDGTVYPVGYAAPSNPLVTGSGPAFNNAPWDGTVTDVYALVENENPSYSVTFALGAFCNAGNIALPATVPGGVSPTTIHTTPNLNVPAGQLLNLTLGFTSSGGGGVVQALVFGFASPFGYYQIYGNFIPQAGLATTPAAPSASANSMTAWGVGYGSQAYLGKIIQTITLQRSQDGGATWNTVDTHTDNTNGLNGAQYSITDSGVAPGSLQYRVQATNASGTVSSAVFVCPIPGTPGPPTLTPVSLTSWSLSWLTGGNTAQYVVQRSTDGGGTWSTIATVAGTSYTDPSSPAGTLAYRVVAQNSVGTTTGLSTTAGAPGAPVAPTLTETLT